MKKILVLGLMVLSFSAMADFRRESRFMQRMESDRTPASVEGVRNMFEFNADSILAASLAFDNSKVQGSDAKNDSRANVSLNYAMGVTSMIQLGARVNYFSGLSGSNDHENFDFSVGGILNTEEDFAQASYLSLYVGAGWAEEFGPNTRDDLRFATLAVGKRFKLDQMGIKHVTYSPEIAVKNVSSTTGRALDYSQSLQFRILQFSVFY
jgi:hypothetical protein